MDSLLQFVQTFWIALQNGTLPHLGAWNYVLLSLLVAVEGPIATLLGAAAASAGYMRPVLVFLAAALGNLVSDTLWYQLGYAGKIEWFSRYGRWLGIRPHHLEHLQQGMHEHATKLLLVAKLTAGLMIPSLVAAGLARVPWRRWFPTLLAGETLWTGTLVLIGYYTTEAIKQVAEDVEKVGIAGSVIFVILVVFLFLRRYLRRNKELQAYNEMTDEDQINLNKG